MAHIIVYSIHGSQSWKLVKSGGAFSQCTEALKSLWEELQVDIEDVVREYPPPYGFLAVGERNLAADKDAGKMQPGQSVGGKQKA